jgi:hypothetical protein
VILVFLVLTVLFVYHSSSVLLRLFVLEMLSFFLIYFVSSLPLVTESSRFLLLTLFSVFVIEGVVGICSLIFLVSFTGSDYVSSSNSALI